MMEFVDEVPSGGTGYRYTHKFDPFIPAVIESCRDNPGRWLVITPEMMGDRKPSYSSFKPLKVKTRAKLDENGRAPIGDGGRRKDVTWYVSYQGEV